MTSTTAPTNVRTASSTAAAPAAPVSFGRLAFLHARYGLLETLRIPIAVIGNTVFPALALLFFVVPQRAVAEDPAAATAATVQLSVFAVMSVCVFSYGAGVAEDRALPFDPFLRTLPAGPWPRMAGRIATGTVMAMLGIVPIVLVATLFTDASITWSHLGGGLVALAAAGIPFLLIGLLIGYSLSAKAAIAVAQLVVFPLAFAGGLFIPPQMFPAWMQDISAVLPSRAARDVVVGAAVEGSVPTDAVVVLAVWAVVLAVAVAWAYRRDEGRRFH